jgi:hypothetical protein
MRLRWIITVAVAVLGIQQGLVSANADTIQLDFTISGLPVGQTDPLSGAITYDAASSDAAIDSLSSISLTLGSHTYSLAEIGFEHINSNVDLIGGLLHGVEDIVTNSDDFFLEFDHTSLSGSLIYFYYTLFGNNTTFHPTATMSYAETDLSTPPPSTPLPSTWLMLVSGFIGLGFFAYRGSKKNVAAIAAV